MYFSLTFALVHYLSNTCTPTHIYTHTLHYTYTHRALGVRPGALAVATNGRVVSVQPPGSTVKPLTLTAADFRLMAVKVCGWIWVDKVDGVGWVLLCVVVFLFPVVVVVVHLLHHICIALVLDVYSICITCVHLCRYTHMHPAHTLPPPSIPHPLPLTPYPTPRTPHPLPHPLTGSQHHVCRGNCTCAG